MTTGGGRAARPSQACPEKRGRERGSRSFSKVSEGRGKPFLAGIMALLLLLAGCSRHDWGVGGGKGIFSEAPSGSDVLSASTNRSEKDDVTAPKLDPASGTGFVAPPEIGNYGSVNLTYPVEVPAGRAGISPGVSLSYSSSSGDGLCGMGWNLSTGLGVIARTTSHGQLYYDHRDTFTWNGKRLVKVSGPAGSEIGTYRQEIEKDFALFEYDGARWKVTDKSGTVTILGDVEEHRTFDPEERSRVYLWHFSRREDLNGNFMTAEYDDAAYARTNIRYLKKIRYTGNRSAGMDANQFVRFTYREREEAYLSKAPGFIMRMDRLLEEVRVGWDDPEGSSGIELWSYKLIYEDSDESGRPLLMRIDSDRTATSPRFTYSETEHTLVWQKVRNASGGAGDPASVRYFEGDFNGDGISDMVWFNPETGDWKAAEGTRSGGYTFPVYGNRYRGYDTPEEIQFFKGNVTGDYNGDGRSDIAFYLPETKEFIVAEHNGRTFDFVNYGHNILSGIDIFSCEWFSGDYDGNGLSDAVLFHEPTGQWLLMRNRGKSFEFIIFSRHFKNIFRDDYIPDYNLDSEYTSDSSRYGRHREMIHFLSGDFNGDGRSDISIYDERSGVWYVAENYRDEVNGFRLEWIKYADYSLPVDSLFTHDRFTGDFNGDGFSDVLVLDRSSGKWWLGETGDRSISFRVFGSTPEHREITRWLQGDFNGDGRTDIGFYSETDGRFWIGEASPGGFRYRIYSDMSHGPDERRVMETSLPKDEVNMRRRGEVVTDGFETSIVHYVYDDSYHTDRGEEIFSGYYSGSEPELLIYRKNDNGFYTAAPGDSPDIYTGVSMDVDGETSRFIGRGRIGASVKNSTGIFAYQYNDQIFGPTEHSIIKIGKDPFWGADTFLSFTSSSFDYTTTPHIMDDFTGSGEMSLLYPEPGSGSSALRHVTSGGSEDLALHGDLSEYDLYEMQASDKLVLFSAPLSDTTGERAKLLVVDTRYPDHVWYKGEISGTSVTFTRLSGTANLPAGSGPRETWLGKGNSMILARSGEQVTFYRYEVSSGSVTKYVYSMPGGYTWEGGRDASGNPILSRENGFFYVTFSGDSRQIRPLESGEVSCNRPDLYERYYPFRWIQGDYNGDGKTDIGIFHLNESEWYYALSRGEAPDVMTGVENGIGGRYGFEYENSTTMDNTGEDGVAHLPMNYLVCTSLTIEDGMGNRVRTDYRYAGGYAFSAFIDGYKETDYFGFSEFHVIDAYGGEEVSYYNTTPYADFRKNRALAGAVKEIRELGTDKSVYSVTEHDYIIHEITDGTHRPSYLIEPTRVKTRIKGTDVTTVESRIELEPGKYELKSRRETRTDHYSDSVREPVSITSFESYESITATNETRLIRRVEHEGSRSELTTLYDYDDPGNLTGKRTSYTGSGLDPAPDRILRFEYDRYGNRTAEIDSSGSPSRRVETEYDDRLKQYPARVVRHVGGRELATGYGINYDSAFGKAERETDPNGNRVIYEYDEYGRLERQRADAPGGLATLNSYAYSDEFPLSAKVTQHTGTGDEDIKTRVYADGMNRVITTVSTGNRGMTVAAGPVTYDAAGRVIRKGQNVYVPSSMLERFSPSLMEKNATRTEYDKYGRVHRVTLPRAAGETGKTAITTTYQDPWQSTVTDPEGMKKITVKNGRGLILSVEERGTGETGEVSSRIGFAYDEAGRRIKKMELNETSMSRSIDPSLFSMGVLDDSGYNIAQWRYDGFGRVTGESDPDRGYTRQVHNGFGEVTETGDARGMTTFMEYDSLGRMTRRERPEGIVTYIYDSHSESANGLGRLVRVEEEAGEKRLSYDPLGRVVSEKRTIQGDNREYLTKYAHDLQGRKKSITYPEPQSGNRLTVTYEYGSQGIRRVRAKNGFATTNIVENMEYDEQGNLTLQVLGSGVVTSYSYDEKQRLVRKYSTAMSNGERKILSDRTLTWRRDDLITSISGLAEIGTDGDYARTTDMNYSYDGLKRLVDAEGIQQKETTPGLEELETNRYSRAYRYAESGNLIRKVFRDPDTGAETDRWNYTYRNHAVTEIHSTARGARFIMGYDDSGNMTRKRDLYSSLSKEMEYDSRGDIVEVTDGSGTLKGRYTYDDQGLRVKKRALRVVDGREKYVEILHPSMYYGLERYTNRDGTDPGSGTAEVNHIYVNGIRIAALKPDNTVRYYMTDQVDSVSLVLDGQGKPVSRFEYMPYGETWISEKDERLDETHNPKFNSQELDHESGFYYYNARYYDPEIARFVSPDSVIDGEYSPAGWNRYMYVKGNPVGVGDPSGNWSVQDFRNPLERMGNYLHGRGWNTNQEVASARSSTERDVKKVLQRSKDKDRYVNNTSKKYVYQDEDVKNYGRGACNVSSISMITGEDPNKIDKELSRKKLGRGHEQSIYGHLHKEGYKSKILASGYDRKPGEKDFKAMRSELKKGKLILYHMAGRNKKVAGHYLVLKGYRRREDGEYDYIFHDPAGNKKKGYWRGREDGENVTYSRKDLERWKIRGTVRSVHKDK